jgi:predicted DCC family thiol-disulfide oxidoreductase YuxK
MPGGPARSTLEGMTAPAHASGPPASGGHPIVFFDGVCALCNGFADFVLARDRDGRFRIAALQGETAAAMGASDAQPAGREPPGAAGDPWRSILLWEGGCWYRKSDAALRVIARLGGPWGLARPLLWVPRNIRDTVYDFIARHRYRWFGKRETCRMPTAAESARFLP